MDNFRFKSLEDLYKRLLPAFTTKVNDIKRNNINNIKEIDLWNYLKNNEWMNKKDLTLGEMVNDILTLNINDVQEYLLGIRNKKMNPRDLL